MVKQIRKLLYIIIVLIISGVAIGALALIIYKDRIIEMVKSEVDNRIKTELAVEKIDINILRGFPNISIQFTGVKFHSAFEEELLIEGRHMYFVVSVLDLFYNKISIERLEIDNAKLIIHKDEDGNNNYDVFKVTETIASNDGSLDIGSVKFLDVEIVHMDETRSINDEFKISNLLGSVALNDSIYKFGVQANGVLSKTNKAYLDWLKGKSIYLNTNSTYNADEIIDFDLSDLTIDNSDFKFSGFVELKARKRVSFILEGENLQFSNLASLFPEKVRSRISHFDANGMIGFDASLKGNFANNNWPGFFANFKLKDFVVSHAQLEFPMKDLYLDGDIDIDNLSKLGTAHLEVSKFEASVNNKVINIKGSIDNFENPLINTVIKGDVDVAWLMSLGLEKTPDEYGASTGFVNVDINTSLSMKSDMKSIDHEKTLFNGKMRFENVGLDSVFGLPLRNVRGMASFSNTKVELINLKGFYGVSDFDINGFVMILELNQTGIETKMESKIEIKSNKMDLDEVVKAITSRPRNSSFESEERADFYIDLDLEVNELKFRRFLGKKFRARTEIDQNVVKIRKVISKGLGGSVAFTGSITRQFNGDYYIEAKTKTQTIDLDSLFYVFNDFNQKFITASVVKGDLDSDVYTHMYFNNDWKVYRSLLYAEGVFQVKNGELNKFQPIMSLSSYLKNEEENLANLRFSDLESSIVISNDTVYISDMYIGSNVRNIKVGGYHTLDQAIDYRLSVPISGANRDKDEAFGKVKKDKDGKLFMPFRIKGTTVDYKVNYDLKRASSNLVRSVKGDLSGIGNSLVGKSKVENKGDSLVLDEDEFFDWDDN